MATPNFISRDVNQITSEMIADYEQRTGRTLQPAQVERLLINAFAYRESLVREGIQYAALQNLVEFSNAPVLDYLGQLVGVTRLSASAATAQLDFTLVTGHGGVIIPAGMRVATVDSLAVFTVANDVVVPVGTDTATVVGISVSTGTVANGYAVGTITQILDPLAYVSAVSNTSVSGGGAAQESDEALRERIKLAPATFSVAGPRDAYKAFAFGASPSIIDVTVLGPNDTPATSPGVVEIYPLMEDGSVTPSTVIDLVDAACNFEKYRPLNDQVDIYSPTRIEYALEVEVVRYTTADATDLQAAILAKLNAYGLAKRQKLGQDIKRSHITREAVIDGVFDINIVQPATDILIDPTQFGYCTGVTVTITGSNNG